LQSVKTLKKQLGQQQLKQQPLLQQQALLQLLKVNRSFHGFDTVLLGGEIQKKITVKGSVNVWERKKVRCTIHLEKN